MRKDCGLNPILSLPDVEQIISYIESLEKKVKAREARARSVLNDLVKIGEKCHCGAFTDYPDDGCSHEDKLKMAFETAWNKFTNRTFEHTLKDKNGPHEVTDMDWENASFTMEELRDEVIATYRKQVE